MTIKKALAITLFMIAQSRLGFPVVVNAAADPIQIKSFFLNPP